MPENLSRPARRALVAAGLTTGLAAGLAALLASGAFAAAGPAYAARIMSVPKAPVTVTLKSDSWANQIGTTMLAPVIAAAGADKADKANPDSGDITTGAVLTGAGVGVALIDSGVSPVPGLNGAGKVINGPDLSFESQSPALRYLDTYGHGTHMAGIIAGQDPATGAVSSRFNGVAPGAHVVSLKVASADGASDVSQVIAAIDWAVAHRNDPGLNIRVMNLSFGTESLQGANLDPLSFAVEQAWQKGIVVVVAAGNDGLAAKTLTMPAVNPDVIAVGAADSRNTDIRTDDTVADFTNRGNATRHPDVLASGRSVVSLRDPGSYIDRTYPGALLSTTVDPAQRYFRGSGTSQAAAVVSGAVALLLQQRPTLTPDQIKRLLTSTADPIVGSTDIAAGSGQINIAKAARAKSPKTSDAAQVNTTSTGLGTLNASRGGAYVYDSVSGLALTAETDIFGKAWNPASWTAASRTQTSWVGGTFNGSVWTGNAFGPAQYNELSWTPVAWAGRSWAGVSWAGRTWASALWSGRTWAGQTWSGAVWSGRCWAAAGWTGAPWQ
jgi:serine protease AprX